MEKPIVSPGIDPYALSSAEQESLANRLYKIHCEIFDGVSFENFKNYIFAPGSARTRIYTFSNVDAELVGYIAVHNLAIRLGNRNLRVLKTEVGLQRRYRGSNSSLRILFKEGLRAWFQNRCRNLWFVATPVHPSPYCAVARQMHEMYPRHDQPTPAATQSLMDKISQQLHLQTPNGGSRWQRKVGWQVRNTPEEVARVQQSKNPHVQFYLTHNPNYFKGNGLMLLVPCHPQNALSAIWNLLRKTNPFSKPKPKTAPSVSLG